MQLEKPAQNGKCKFDFVRIFRGNNDYDQEKMIGDLCGRLNEETASQKFYRGGPGESLFVTFNSDNLGVGKGFRAFYIASKTEAIIPKPTLSPIMQKYVISNSKTRPGSAGSAVRDEFTKYTGSFSSQKKTKNKKNKKKKSTRGFGNGFQRIRLWSLSRSQKNHLKNQED